MNCLLRRLILVAAALALGQGSVTQQITRAERERPDELAAGIPLAEFAAIPRQS